MDLKFTEADNAFREEVRKFLDENLPDDLREAGTRQTSTYADHERSLAWQRILHAKGWAAPAWPREYGGAAWSVTQRYIFSRERIRAGAPPLSPMGIQMCGPAIIGHGTPEQKAFFLPRMLSGEHLWCQGYSEPNSGSDLSSLRTRAVDDGDALVCTGSKIWTTHAAEANWGFFLVRTSTLERQQQGITFILVDMASPGITIKPMVSSTGESVQSEIFLDDVRVPKSNVVGSIDEGWSVAKYLLEFERGGAAFAPELLTRLEEIVSAAKDVPGDAGGTLAEDPVFERRVAEARMHFSVLEVFEFRAMVEAESSHKPGPSSSIIKILGTEGQQMITEIGMIVAGRYGIAYQPQAGCPGGPVSFPHNVGAFAGSRFGALAPLRYLNERAATIYGGSNEIQRNILAKGLGL